MGNLTVFDNIIEEKLMNIHTAFIGKVITVNGNAATVQPLNRTKQYGKAEQKQAVLKNVPILNNGKYKLKPYKLEYVKDVTISTSTKNGYLSDASLNVSKGVLETVEREDIKAGDIVFCVCADRDITETKNGKLATPAVGRHHNISDAVIIGII